MQATHPGFSVFKKIRSALFIKKFLQGKEQGADRHVDCEGHWLISEIINKHLSQALSVCLDPARISHRSGHGLSVGNQEVHRPGRKGRPFTQTLNADGHWPEGWGMEISDGSIKARRLEISELRDRCLKVGNWEFQGSIQKAQVYRCCFSLYVCQDGGKDAQVGSLAYLKNAGRKERVYQGLGRVLSTLSVSASPFLACLILTCDHFLITSGCCPLYLPGLGRVEFEAFPTFNHTVNYLPEGHEIS